MTVHEPESPVAAGAADAPTATGDDFSEFLDVLDLANPTEDAFIGRHPSKVAARTFGGQIMSQAIVAGGRTTDVPLHVAHTHFIRGGETDKDLEFRVTRLRDTRNTANRQVSVEQNGEVLALVLLGYQTDARNPLEHADPAPDVPGPEGLPPVYDSFAGYEEVISQFVEAPHPMDMRYTNDPAWIMKKAGDSLDYNRVWIRTARELPDDQVLHDASLAYASDTTILDSIITRHGLSWGFDRIMAATLNQSIWYHRRVRFDEFHLYATHSPVAAGGRGTAHGQIFDRSGLLTASVTQEGVLKYFPAKAES
ncbi:acyl-CoA thioesterase II [Tsukamurella sp. 8F]|uniref:acyl-CoA thioesterase n=1 Tax=unclassified Tsukamurella TaxID=2633480 RepID=UPI0023B8ACE9|nr:MULTISPECIES: acyl-CoA thioesterase II [unclassified Tsukamurella]MDF0528631.1 acyl-CoA thioesterase II [Tsukamurella sp. 8J]MDF0585593.1 acyl-CoA thioesterase II [Tsukamurella sp. 8F]